LFRKQISEQKPITVTDPLACRWFLTSRQAVEAILASGPCDVHGIVLLPKVGEPLRITDLAAFLIQTSQNGNSPPTPVVFTALRPGDKLNEEMISATERRTGEVYGQLEVVETQRFPQTEVECLVDELASRVSSHDLPGLVRALVSAVPEYVPSRHLLQQAGLLAAFP
jgi:FlaA1/EpsC-like NDP-sugar epimerase